MKIETETPKVFKPFKMVIETEAEAKYLWNILNFAPLSMENLKRGMINLAKSSDKHDMWCKINKELEEQDIKPSCLN